MSLDHEEKSEFHDEKTFDEKVQTETLDLDEDSSVENSKIEAVRLGRFTSIWTLFAQVLSRTLSY